jgi:Ca-activated chloride channel family protein
MNMRIIHRLPSWAAAAVGAVVISSCTLWTAALISAVVISSCAVSPEPEAKIKIESREEARARRAPAPVGENEVASGPAPELPAVSPAMSMPRAVATRMAPVSRHFGAGPADRDAFASVGPGEELWIIATPSTTAEGNEDDSPGSGAMVTRFPDDIDEQTGKAKEIPLPLKHTDVRAAINGYISTVNVRQKFENPFNEKIEAVYMFPLPEKAAVSEFLMVIGERRIRGIVRKTEEAQSIYNAARSQGYQASLLVQHRPNVFEQKVANIEPGKSIDVDIKYFHTLSYNDGWYSFVFPTVVGPRYNPPGHQDPIVPVPRGSITPQSLTAVHYLRPKERSAHDLSINVAIDAGVAIEEFKSSHKIVASQDTAESATVELASRTTIPNKDFVLKFRVAGDTIKSNLLAYEDPDTLQGYFTLMVYPPAGVDALARRWMEMVFVLDCSGSMSGRPLEQARNAVATALNHLQEGDTFQIIRFSDNSSQFGETPVPATRENLVRARRYLERLSGSGGTQMIEGVKAALDFPA